MANINISIRIDTNLKKQFETLCTDMGVTTTTVFNIFARKAMWGYRIPFGISGDAPDIEAIEAIQEIKRIKADPGLDKAYSNVDEMMRELLTDV